MVSGESYWIGGLTFTFPGDNEIRILCHGKKVSIYFPWQNQRDQNTVVWMVVSMFEVWGNRSIQAFCHEWADIIGKDEAVKVYQSVKEHEEEFFDFGLEGNEISDIRRLASVCMMEHHTPAEIAQKQITEAHAGFHAKGLRDR